MNAQPTNARVMIEKLRRGLLPIVRVAGEDVRWTMDERLAHYECPGVGVAVLEDGKVSWSAGYGRIERGLDRPVEADTVFAGASISKPITAALVMQQVERGVLDMDADVNGYLTAWKVPENAFTRATPVTLRHLLSHKAGTTVHGFGRVPPGAASPSLLDVLSGRPPAVTPPVIVDKTPGGTVRYSGGGYMVVQLVLEEMTGKPFAALAREMIFDPLGMSRSTFVDPLPPELQPFAATGHDEEGAPLPEKWTSCPMAAAGGLYTSAGDFGAFMGACRDAYVGRPTPLMSQATAKTMLTLTPPDDFALGWRVVGEGAEARIEHGGSCTGYQCETTCYLESGKGAVVLTNAVSGLTFYWEVLNAIADLYDWPGFLPPPKVVQPITPAVIAALAGRYAIVSGVDAPFLDIWAEDGGLKSHIGGMRGGPNVLMMDERGRLFHRAGPYETAVTYGQDGRAIELSVLEGGATEILHARRAEG
ncbi:MAG TPA: serine hydrolase domain-containing protein [Caulobacteraceae bacterium]|nr:serine hydrolase domain-containing protein [Caulobacteraceae bacterium]